MTTTTTTHRGNSLLSVTVYVFLLLLLLHAPQLSHAVVLSYEQQEQQQPQSPTQLETCYQALQQADANGNHQVDRDEYVAFGVAMIPTDMRSVVLPSAAAATSTIGITDYSQLPLSLQAAFLSSACLCGSDSYASSGANSSSSTTTTDSLNLQQIITTTVSACCLGTDAHIRVPPNTSDDTAGYLYSVCSITSSAIEAEYLRNTIVPAVPSPTIVQKHPTPAPVNLILTLYPTLAAANDDDDDDDGTITGAPTVSTTTSLPPTPTVAPTSIPVEAPPEPTAAAAPTIALVPVKTSVEYVIAVPAAATGDKNNTTADTGSDSVAYLADLQTAVDQLAQVVLGAVVVAAAAAANDTTNGRRRQQRRLGSGQLRVASRQGRRLQVTLQLPTRFGPISDRDCPSDSEFQSPEFVCQNVTSIITLLGVDSNDADAVQAEFEQAMTKTIQGGRLQSVLSLVNLDTPVRIVPEENVGQDNLAKTPAPAPAAAASESRWTTAGIVAASVGPMLVVVSLLLLLARFRNNDKHSSSNVIPATNLDKQSDLGLIDNDDDDDDEQPTTTTMTSSSERVMTASSSDTSASIIPMGSIKERTSFSSSSSSSSSTTSSGYQTLTRDAGFGMMPRAGPHGSSGDLRKATPVGLGAAGLYGLSTSDSKDSQVSSASSGVLPHVSLSTSTLDIALYAESSDDIGLSNSSETVEETRDRLDHALQTHDWAVVGDAAALLAAASEDPALSEKVLAVPNRFAIRGIKSNVIVESTKVKQLDKLVAQQDWDGLVNLAGHFEAEECERRSSRGSSDAESTSGSRTSGSVSGSEIGASTSGSDVGSQSGMSGSESDLGTRGSLSTSMSGRTSNAQVAPEIRAEIVSLVQRVVPEEMDNVDEMMKNFRGKEDQLVETLRSMQERSVAQRARAVKQKAAKVEARQQVKSQRTGDSDFSILLRPDHNVPAVTSALTLSPVSSGDEGKSDRNDVLGVPREFSVTTPDASSSGGSQNEDGSAYALTILLEQAIESGDWQAVADAAALMSDASATVDIQSSPVSRMSTKGSVDVDLLSDNRETSLDHIDSSRLRELDEMIVVGDWTGVIEASQRYNQEDEQLIEAGRSKEEEEALQQAALWETIAEKSRQGAAEDVGAANAAAWAIQRSFSQLKEKESPGNRGDSFEHGGDNEV